MDCDVAIIGAGFSGVSAARDLHHLGISTSIFEARDRIGAVAGGVWLVIGPWLHQTWSTTGFQPMAGSTWKTALRWIAYFYGAGALAVYLGAQAQGLLERATVKAAASAPAMPYRMPAQTGAPAQRPEPERRQPTSSHSS